MATEQGVMGDFQMNTKFKLIFEGNEPDIEIPKFERSLPANFEVTKEGDGIYITIKSERVEDVRCQYLVNRELDRHFFLTSIKIRAERIRSRVAASLTIKYRIHGSLPENITPQRWNYELPIQLKLWSITVDSDNIPLKLILLFQIIELSYPDQNEYPEYTDSLIAPDPLTECKFLRHLVAHSGEVKGTQLKRYCKYLNIPELMLDLTDPGYISILKRKLNLIETQAKNAILKSL